MAIKTQPYTVEHVDSVVGGLHGLKAEFENRHLTELFAEDPQRFEKFSVTLEPVVFDFSKHRVNQPVVKNLVQWAQTRRFNVVDKAFIFYEEINYTEQRAAMHWALRLPKHDQSSS